MWGGWGRAGGRGGGDPKLHKGVGTVRTVQRRAETVQRRAGTVNNQNCTKDQAGTVQRPSWEISLSTWSKTSLLQKASWTSCK